MSLIQNNEDLKQKIGGQAVIEGVMMRSPNSYAVAVRKADGQLVIKEQAWQSIWSRIKFFQRLIPLIVKLMCKDKIFEL